MVHADLEFLGKLRLVVGYLGEQTQNRWWTSDFFNAGSKTFLTPVFPRTILLSQYHGIVQVASRIHDEHIGIGQVYHLFRLPEDLEQDMHTIVQIESVKTALGDLVHDSTVALNFLFQSASPNAEVYHEGPTLIGSTSSLRELDPWPMVAAHYAQAFQNDTRVYPYFSDTK